MENDNDIIWLDEGVPIVAPAAPASGSDDGIIWLDDIAVGKRMPSRSELANARREAKQERAAAEEMRAANRQARLDAKPTSREKYAKTRARNQKLKIRANMTILREQQRLDRLARLALHPPRKKRRAPSYPPLPY